MGGIVITRQRSVPQNVYFTLQNGHLARALAIGLERQKWVGVVLEIRKALLGHANGYITTHYSAAEISELIDATETIVDRGTAQSPTLTLVSKNARKVSEKCRK